MDEELKQSLETIKGIVRNYKGVAYPDLLADMLDAITATIARLERERDGLKAIVDQLPVNASGDRVWIGMNQYAPGVDPCDPDSGVAEFGFISMNAPESEDGEVWGDVRGVGGDEWRTSVCRCYSTREAAEAADEHARDGGEGSSA